MLKIKRVIKKGILFFFWEVLYFYYIISITSIAKFLIGADAFSIRLQKIPYNSVIVKFLQRYGATIDKTSVIRRGFYIHCPQGVKKPFKNLVIGKDCYIDMFVFIDLTNQVKIGSNTRLSSGVKIYSHLANYQRGQNHIQTKKSKVEIGNNCRLYPNVLISSGATIEDKVLIGAGSVVLNNKLLERNSLYGGVPALLKAKFN